MLSIIEYAWRWNISTVIEEITQILNQPEGATVGMHLLKSAFTGEKSHNALNYIRTEIEKNAIRGFFERMENDKERKTFIERYNKQIDEDHKTLARWHETQKVERSGMTKATAGENYRDAYEEAVIN
jgi:hypothetical protein